MNAIRIILINVILLPALTLSAKDYKASLFGVKSDGITLNTGSIQKAIDFISGNGGGRLVFYVGRYLTGTLRLKSNVTIQLEEGAILSGTPSVYDYSSANGIKALITANNQQNIGITGKGVIDGQGAALLDQINIQIQKGYLKESIAKASPALIAMDSCNQITIDQINLVNACGIVQSYTGCGNLSVNGVSVRNKVVKGSIGIFISWCKEVKLTDSYFETSGAEISSTGTSKNVKVINCKNALGKKLQARN
jgi:polygalacturonase